MRKKKEHDKDSNPNSKHKSSQHKSTKNQNSILKLHDDKMIELNIVSTEKHLKELHSSLQKNLEDIDLLKKDFALKRVNRKGISDLESDTPFKISRLEVDNKSISKEIEYIQSGNKETDYILSTCNLINDYVLLEDRERDLMMKEYDNCIEQELYELNQKKNDIIDDYMKVINPNYTSFRKMICNRKDIYCENCDKGFFAKLFYDIHMASKKHSNMIEYNKLIN